MAALLSALLACSPPLPQDPAAAASRRIAVQLAPRAPDADNRLGWSPKAASVPLRAAGEALVGAFPLGPEGAPPVAVELSRSPGAAHFDRLAIDLDRDGAFGDGERLTTTPKDNRGKWWSSFDAEAQVPFPGGARQPYPIALWFVADPQEPDAAPALRWTRRGWRHGVVDLGGAEAHVVLVERALDGVFTAADSWQIGRDRKTAQRAEARGLDTHAWLDGRAWRVAAFAADGASLQLEPCTPELTEAQERERADLLRADREARRAAAPLAFGADLDAALAAAAKDGKRVFVDFETTWCGPCKQMDQWVYTAHDVVAAAADTGVLTVKLDGDVARELVKKYEVKGYPTLLLLDGKGAVVRRAVGYQGVAAMARFLRD